MERKAKYIGKHYDRYYTELYYSYRGYEYTVYDYKFITFDTLSKQHKEEQARIDAIIEDRERMRSRKPMSPTVQETLDKLFEFWETGNEEVFS